MSTDLVGIDLVPRPTDTIGDRIRRAGQAKALLDFATTVNDATRAALRKDVDALAEATGGGGFTKKVHGIRTTLTDPKAKAHVADAEAFGAWLKARTNVEVETAERVEVHSPRTAAIALRVIDEPTFAEDFETLAAAARDLAASLKVTTDTILPGDVIGHLLAGKHEGPPVLIDEDERLVWVDIADGTTHEVPGTYVTPPANPQMQVVPDDDAKSRDLTMVMSFFGVDPAALERGDA